MTLSRIYPTCCYFQAGAICELGRDGETILLLVLASPQGASELRNYLLRVLRNYWKLPVFIDKYIQFPALSSIAAM